MRSIERPSRATARIALFGGIYSNHHALESAIADCRARGIETICCLGDLGAFGPHPDLVFPLIREHGVRTLAGNYDDSIARGLSDCQCGYTDPRDEHYARLSYRYTFQRTSPANRRFLAELPSEIRLVLGGWRVLLCHGSPRRQNEFLWESTTSDAFLERLCDVHRADVIAVTHTGIKWKRRLPSGRLFINAGVLGRPENDGTPRVWYTVLEPSEGAACPADGIAVEFVPVDYDHEALAREMEREDLPREFIETIRTGWWTTCLEVLPQKERRRGRF